MRASKECDSHDAKARRHSRDDGPMPHQTANYFSRSLISCTKSTGRCATPIPASLNASIFSAAVPAEPEMLMPWNLADERAFAA